MTLNILGLKEDSQPFCQRVFLIFVETFLFNDHDQFPLLLSVTLHVALPRDPIRLDSSCRARFLSLCEQSDDGDFYSGISVSKEPAMVIITVKRIRVKKKNPNPRDKCTVLHSELLLQSGCVEQAWRWRGDDVRGSGWRGVASRWKLGESGKQNKELSPVDGFSDETVSIQLVYVRKFISEFTYQFKLDKISYRSNVEGWMCHIANDSIYLFPICSCS